MVGFDIRDFLSEHDIRYTTAGKNVSSGWIEIHCPFDYCSDPSYHLGINIESGNFHCWICGAKGSFVSLVKKLLDCTFTDAKQEVEKYENSSQVTHERINQHTATTVDINELLSKYSPILPTQYREYLINRNFDPDYLQQTYGIREGGIAGYFAYRLIIPIFSHGFLQNLTSRTIDKYQVPKYLHLPNSQGFKPIKQLLYNIDKINIGGKVIICEGVFDVWRIGDEAIATFGTEVTSEQIFILSKKKLSKVRIVFDSDAIKKANKLANQLSIFIPNIEIIELEDGDPASISSENIKKIKDF